MCLQRFWRPNLSFALLSPPPSLSLTVLYHYGAFCPLSLPCLAPSTVSACLLAIDSFHPTPLLLIYPLPPSLSLCFSFATLCTRVKPIFFCLRAAMRYIYSLLPTGFPAFVLFLWACLFLVSSDSVPCIYLEPVAGLVLHTRNVIVTSVQGRAINCRF